MKAEPSVTHKPYKFPNLEQHLWTNITGVSLPIGTSALDNPLEKTLQLLG
jgi:hypothetical protein